MKGAENAETLTFKNPQVLDELSALEGRRFELGTHISSNDLEMETVGLIVTFAREKALSFVVVDWKGSIDLKAVQHLIDNQLKVVLQKKEGAHVPLELILLCNWIIHLSSEHSPIEATLVEYRGRVKDELRQIIVANHEVGPSALIAPFDLAPVVQGSLDVASWKETGEIVEWPTFQPASRPRTVLECKDYVSIFIRGCKSEGLAGVAFKNVALYWQE